MLSVFTLPFSFREPPYDWLIVCLILLNIVAVIALFAAYIEFKLYPPLPKFCIHNVFDYIVEFTSVRNVVLYFAILIDVVLLFAYIGMVSARITHLILFE